MSGSSKWENMCNVHNHEDILLFVFGFNIRFILKWDHTFSYMKCITNKVR